jgi:hypothetical protein
MADARLKTIRDAILTRIQGINGAGGGYNYTIGQSAGAELKLPDAVTGFPAAFVYEAGVDRSANRMGDGAAAFRSIARIGIKAYTRGTTAKQDIINWCYDIVRAVEAAPLTLGLAYVDNLRCVTIEEARSEAIAAEPWGEARLVFEVGYSMSRAQI